MSGQKTTVFGIYPTYPNVEQGAKALRAAGFRDSDISVLSPDRPESKEDAQAKSNKIQAVATVGGGPGALDESECQNQLDTSAQHQSIHGKHSNARLLIHWKATGTLKDSYGGTGRKTTILPRQFG